MRIYQILALTIFLSLFLSPQKCISSCAISNNVVFLSTKEMVKDSIIITGEDAEKAFKSAKNFYSNAYVFIILSVLLTSTGGIITLAFLKIAQQNWEKAFLYYDTLGNAEKVEALRNMLKLDNVLWVVSLISAFSPILLLVLFLALLGTGLGFSLGLIFTSFFAATFFGIFILMERMLFKTKKILEN